MSMPQGSTSSMMMVPYLHFTGGDYLFFQTWRPTSSGAIAGACIGLALLGILDRWIAASRSVLQNHWQQKSLALISQRGAALPSGNSLSEKSEFLDVNLGVQVESKQAVSNPPSIVKRTIPPFIAKIDVPRGLIHACQSLLGYILMLAVMTFNAAFIISIILGLGIGEVIFGRMGNRQNVAHHP